MILVVGGSYAGKTEYIKKRFGLTDDAILDGASAAAQDDIMQRLETKRCMIHLEEWVRALLAAGRNPADEVGRLAAAYPDRIFALNEIGNGIVPMEKEERSWREAVGQTGCFLAGQAKEVVRVVCGLPVRIK